MPTVTLNSTDRDEDAMKSPFTMQELAKGKGDGIAVDIQDAQLVVSGDVNVDMSGLEALVTATNTAIADELLQYQVNDVDDDSSTKYYGYEDKEGAWYIMKESVVSGDTLYRYAKGASDYATAWIDRASQTYDVFSSTF